MNSAMRSIYFPNIYFLIFLKDHVGWEAGLARFFIYSSKYRKIYGQGNYNIQGNS